MEREINRLCRFNFRLFKADRWMILSMNDSLLDKDFVKIIILLFVKRIVFFYVWCVFWLGKSWKWKVVCQVPSTNSMLLFTIHNQWVIGAKLRFPSTSWKPKPNQNWFSKGLDSNNLTSWIGESGSSNDLNV